MSSYSPAAIRYALLLIFWVAVFNTCDRTLLAVVLQDVKLELGLRDDQLGVLAGPAFAIVHFAAGLPLARAADLYSRRVIVSLGLLAWSAMTAIAGVAQSYSQLLAARLGVGLGEAAGGPASHSLISDLLPLERRARGLSLIQLGSTVGLGLGLAGGGAIAKYWGWRTAFYAAGLPGIALALLIYLTLREPPRGMSDATPPTRTSGSFFAALGELLRTPSYRWLIAGACAAGVLTFGKNIWEPTFLRRIYGQDVAHAGLVYFAISTIPSGLGAIAGGFLNDRLGSRDVRWYMAFGALSHLVAVPLSLCFVLWPESHLVAGIPVAFLFSAAASFVGAFWVPGTMATAQSLARPDQRALSAAVWTMFFNLIGMGAGPFVVGLISQALTAEHGDYAIRYALAWASLAPLAACAFQLLAARRLPQDLAAARAA